MGERLLTAGERFFFMMVWMVLVLIAIGFTLHLLTKNGVTAGIAQKIGQWTDLQSQAGA